MPSRAVYDALLQKGYKVDQDPFLKYDSLASEHDLASLFEVLSSVSDKKGNPARITANTIVANPDFNKIRASGFQTYHYELFTETLKRYPEHRNSFQLWKEGMQQGVFHPQFHGREHLNVARWMKALKQETSQVREAFEQNMISISSEPSDMRFGYMEALDYFSDEEKEIKPEIVSEGLEIFNNIFGYASRSFIACCYVWDNEIEDLLHKKGVNYIQGVVQQLVPKNGGKDHSFAKRYHYIGQRNSLKQMYLTRNAYFEPCLLKATSDHVGYCLKRMEIAFKMKKPAIIASHRLNYIGSIHPENRDMNLKLLKELLFRIKTKWPDIEFLTTDELGAEIDK